MSLTLMDLSKNQESFYQNMKENILKRYDEEKREERKIKKLKISVEKNRKLPIDAEIIIGTPQCSQVIIKPAKAFCNKETNIICKWCRQYYCVDHIHDHLHISRNV